MTPPFSPDTLLQTLRRLPEPGRYLLAYSGGLDSHALLHALASLQSAFPADLLAIHVNHTISEHADRWAQHAQSVCAELDVALRLVRVDAQSPAGRSPEDWARRLRYQALKEEMQSGDLLLTAHHRDDQAETLLLQLLRGAGPKGLAAMPEQCRFGAGRHVRPLLAVSRQSLHEYAVGRNLHWIDDDTNHDRRYARNYVRKDVLPLLQRRWPGVSQTLARAAGNQADAAALMEELAKMDLQSCYQANYRSLDVSAVKRLSLLRQGNLLRHYIAYLNLPLPDRKKLFHILHDVVSSKHDATPCVCWDGAEVRRYAGHLLAMPPLSRHDSTASAQWKLDRPCTLVGESLSARSAMGGGIKKSCVTQAVTVAFRQGGESLRPAGRRCHCKLKKLFQQAGVPPWQRGRIPLLFLADKLVGVVGFWIDECVYAAADEAAWQIDWSGLERVLQFNSPTDE